MPTIENTDQEDGIHRRTRSQRRTRNEELAAAAAAATYTTPTTTPPTAPDVSHLVTTATATPFTDTAFENTARRTLFEPINEATATARARAMAMAMAMAIAIEGRTKGAACVVIYFGLLFFVQRGLRETKQRYQKSNKIWPGDGEGIKCPRLI